MPFAVKNLFDIAGLPTVAGSKINRDRPPATADATLVARLEAAGAILVGALNMGEYAYDFTGENCHDGPSRNPHDTTRMTGGSSGGSGGAVAGGLVPIALGSDTNGSIRVPSSFCGLFGLKPTYGRLSRTGSFPFVVEPRPSRPAGADDRRPRARLRRDAGPRPGRPGLRRATRRAGGAGCSDTGIAGLRIATAGGYFRAGAAPEALSAVDTVAAALGADAEIEIPEAAAGALRRLRHHHRPRARRCISTGCASGRRISTPTCATG